MRFKSLWSTASIAVFFGFSAAAYAMLPLSVWSNTSTVALFLLASSVAAPFLFPIAATRSTREGDATVFSTLGPLVVGLFGLQLWAAATLVVALAGLDSIAWGMMSVSAAFAFLSAILLVVSARVVANVAAKTAHASERMEWNTRLSVLVSEFENPHIVAALRHLSEKIKFASDDARGQISQENMQIADAIKTLELQTSENTTNADEINSLIAKISALVDSREVRTKLARSRS